MICSLRLPRRFVAQGCVRIRPIGVLDPAPESPTQRDRTGPCLQPQAFFLTGAQGPLRVGVTLGVVVTSERLLKPQRRPGPHEGQRGRLAPVVTQQARALASCPIRTLAVGCPVQGAQPMPGGAGAARLTPHDVFRLPSQDRDAVHPATALDQGLRHLEAPPRVGLGRSGCAASRGALSRARRVGRDQEAVCPPPHSLRRDGHRLDNVPGGPAAAIPPERGFGLARVNARQQRLSARRHAGRPPPPQPHSASLFCSATVSAPTRFCSRVCSCARRASVRVC
jgi:hypothetical protein